MAKKVRVYCMYGLGGPLWSGGMETVLAARIRKLGPNVICPATRRYTDWFSIVEDIKKHPDDIIVVIGHSLGGVKATVVTDYVRVDLLILYDLAGGVPSRIGNNTVRCIDIYDTVPDMVPEWRVQPVSVKHAHKIERWFSRYGHTGQDDSADLANKVVAEVKKLAA